MKRNRVIACVGRLFLCLLLLLLCGCQVTLYSGISEKDANEMLSLLRSSGVPTAKVSAGQGLWNQKVDESALSRSLELLSSAGLPRTRYQSMGDVFRKDSMVSTPTEEQARLLYALSQELAGTIAQIDGVLAARVHIVLPEVDSFGNKVSPSSASVFIRHRNDTDLAPHVASIKRMVGNSVRNLQYDAVSVFLFPSAVAGAEAAPAQVSVFGFTVAAESAGLVRGLLLGVLAMFCLLIGGGAWWMYDRKKRLRAKALAQVGETAS